ncbi:pyridoxamine 5'-phosphate oxidase family protein [Acrocarpospora macrocephala]|uniref:Pyridoxamine 5'-phosphate oxidase n=1 Tax=Acrocarpospora macrocephala TaxID=150177 RepID=A0A5M3WWD7_9ACTN|nr:pyridoxamine 5'-phosphate oxidase family protein [Acrocarpospora macrocephala]GES12259.1 pyridoxamine 5'-phosphate oxidase [Acrocarpospora macrocephala]
MRLDAAGLRVLSRQECLHLLSLTPLGRIVFTDHALPAVQPVNYYLDGQNIVIRTATGSKLAVATRDAIVAFEADDIDLRSRTGWSVTAVGSARAVTDQAEAQRLAELPLTPWAPGRMDHFIVIHTEQISGRRLWSATGQATKVLH